ncbi:MAG TPA: Nif3-like dinuclear metal center hexameric protein [Firmicutes bacterium]|nr:Nif3-like dinuclear metal center hexameric protein [Bacillota bacterium]
MLTVREIATVLEKIAPVELAEEWDNVGLLVGRFEEKVNGILLSLDLTPETVEEAKTLSSNLIITHHPPIFKPLKNLRLDQPQGRLWEELIKNGISVYTLHTNYDRSAGGLNQYLAELLHLMDSRPITEGETYLKLVVFIPRGYEEVVMEAITAAGAGWIGSYSHCTFQTSGTGTFLPREGSDPFLGKIGSIERAEEVRLETILPARIKGKVIHALLEAHPYEEVAFDLYPLVQHSQTTGLGRIGVLPTEMTWNDFINSVKEIFPWPHLRCGGFRRERVRNVAVLGGSGGRYLQKAKAVGAEVLITSDLGYHDFMLGKEIGLSLVDPGHHVMEAKGLNQLKEYLFREYAGEDLLISISKTQVNPYF